jgi:hypothetical protein
MLGKAKQTSAFFLAKIFFQWRGIFCACRRRCEKGTARSCAAISAVRAGGGL